MKKILTITILIIVGFYFYFKKNRYEVVITQEKIDSVLSKKFPKSKNYLVVFTLTYSNPEVMLLEEDDRVQVGLDATINFAFSGKAADLRGGATVTCGIRYENETQEFFLDDVEFERLEIEGVPEKWLSIVSEIAPIAARDFIENEPIHKIKAKDTKTRVAKLILKDVEVREQSIRLKLGF